MCMLLLFIDIKCNIYLGIDIKTYLFLNNLLIKKKVW